MRIELDKVEHEIDFYDDGGVLVFSLTTSRAVELVTELNEAIVELSTKGGE